jgi:3-hydroxybutyryl-CoA dehydrogenase
MREVWDLLDRGVASASDIDAAVRGSMGFRLAALGPLQIHDFGGLDIQAAVYRNLCPEIRSDTQLPETVQRLVAAGHYGFKTGHGFYDYTPETAAAARSERDQRFLALLKLFYDNADAKCE